MAANLERAGLRLVAPDLPGWGESEAEPEACRDLFDYEARAIEALARAQDDPVHLVGHSYGGNLALYVALAGRIPVRSLVLFEPTLVQLLRDDKGPYAEIERFVNDYRRAHAAGDKWAVRGVIDFWGGPGSFDAMPENARSTIAAWVPRNLRHWEPALQRHALFDELDRLRIPVTIVQSGRAHPTARLIARRLSERIAGSRVLEIAGANHFMILTHPVETARIIRESLST
jgi:pimeloyl-ACP methyl ester carboxylesterase